jgi:hypothetical protein
MDRLLAGWVGLGSALTTKVIAVLCVEYPPLPSTVTVYVPAEPLHERVDLSEPPITRLFVENEQEIPAATVAERPTVPE